MRIIEKKLGIEIFSVFVLVLLMSFSFIPQSHAQTIFGTDVDIDELVEIEEENGDVTDIGPLGFAVVEGLACDVNTQTLYGADDTTDQLVTIDQNTGEATAVGPFGIFFSVFGLAFDPTTNTLYGSNLTNSQLLIINTETGEAGAVGPFGINNVRSLAFDPVSRTLYGVSVNTNVLLIIDQETGAATEIGNIGPDNIVGLTYDPTTRKLLGSGGNEFYEINPDTGFGTLITDDLGNVHGLASCNTKETANIPTLSEWGLIAMALILGAAGYLAVRRRAAAA